MPRPLPPLDPTKPRHSFAIELRELRDSAGRAGEWNLTCKRLGIAKGTLYAWLNGKHIPGRDNLENLAKIWGANPQYWVRRRREAEGSFVEPPAPDLEADDLVLDWEFKIEAEHDEDVPFPGIPKMFERGVRDAFAEVYVAAGNPRVELVASRTEHVTARQIISVLTGVDDGSPSELRTKRAVILDALATYLKPNDEEGWGKVHTCMEVIHSSWNIALLTTGNVPER
ncbi:helix-turn-helix transcriptional regulator [Streptomyces crystallinus]|uniref:HTH cro/C1-type domain-containing protein n=1 Tax=Streptomyces crystallinus TaxID=68191 RepID=A0ABP3Q3G4_9ACTN